MLSIMQIDLVFFILQGPQTAALQQWQIIFMPRWVLLLYAVLPALRMHLSLTTVCTDLISSSVRAVLSFLLTRCLSRYVQYNVFFRLFWSDSQVTAARPLVHGP
ncbi:hypothetical protein B0H14DRAFT_2956563 [Mycena olivaceomarginata]|nr:hypothetical protein B0H14DRAFT_2956563 [Mycena olivaceomarginata]